MGFKTAALAVWRRHRAEVRRKSRWKDRLGVKEACCRTWAVATRTMKATIGARRPFLRLNPERWRSRARRCTARGSARTVEV